MFAKTLETIQATEGKRAAYTKCILAILVICVVGKIIWFSRIGSWHDRVLVDFDVFHIIAERVWRGDLAAAYEFAKLLILQREVTGGTESFMPWTYPPQFSLVLAPLAFVSVGTAYCIFISLTLAFYLATLRHLARGNFVIVLIVLFPTIAVTISCGQNGFLTAGLIGLVCIHFEKRPIIAGLALGALIIKPHLAVAFALYAIMQRRWSMAATAGAVVLSTSALCTVIFGTDIWSGLHQSVRDSSIFLKEGLYPLYRMISFYASLRTAGFSAESAFVGQAVFASLALGLVFVSAYRGMPVRSSLGLTAIVSFCISPYAYDYDFTIFGIGLALLLPALQASAREGERGLIYVTAIVTGGYGMLRALQLGASYSGSNLDIASIGGIAIAMMLTLTFVILTRPLKSNLTKGLSTNASVA